MLAIAGESIRCRMRLKRWSGRTLVRTQSFVIIYRASSKSAYAGFILYSRLNYVA
ncbi:hypothetical protein AVDCRST_MAG84-4271 [uncultured Microcoleus sp.]|uniref:Uncharacterized protein n=1 Tax=uncultured Microcoleus sp. TaxID=259945 RepID=A0A6J4MVW3_9CYAN|nr:hypothetical protein AVDCRST_MAG84-4271 [uncultured Microcoleus sp.]